MSAIRLLCGALALALAACSSVPPQTVGPKPTNWGETLADLDAFQSWRLIGKIGIRSPQENASAQVQWQQQTQAFQIHINGPLGQGAAELVGSPDKAWVKIAGQEPFHTDQPTQLLEQQTGWTIPIDTLAHWVKGIPAPQMRARLSFNDEGRLSHLEQGNWSVHYSRYQPLADLWLPRRIQLQRDQVQLTLVVKDWATLDAK